MYKSVFSKIIFVVTAAIVFASCTKPNTQGKLIPKEAAFVIMLDGKSLSAKLPWDEIRQNPLLLEMSADSGLPAALRSILDNPENSGMDTKADCLLFAVKDPRRNDLHSKAN